MTTHVHPHSSVRRRLGDFGLLALPGAILATLLVLTSATGPTLCPFALLTGVACPGCGMTRAAGALVRGDWAAAFAYHPLVILAAAWVAGAWWAAVSRRLGSGRRIDPRLTNRLVIASAVLFLAVWLGRLATGSLPPV